MIRAALALLLAAVGCQRNAAPPPGAVSAEARDGALAGAVVAKIGKITGQWADFTPAEGGVTVSAPGVPLANVWDHSYGLLQVRDVDYFLGTPADGLSLTVAVTVFPAGALKGLPLDEVLTGAAGHHLAFEPASRKDTPTTVGDIPALDVTATTAEGATMRLRVVAGNDRVYVASAFARPERAASPDIERFLQSMRVR